MSDPDIRRFRELLEKYLANPNFVTMKPLYRKLHSLGKWAVNQWTDEIDMYDKPKKFLRCAVMQEMLGYVQNLISQDDLFRPFADSMMGSADPAVYWDVVEDITYNVIDGLKLLQLVDRGFANTESIDKMNEPKRKRIRQRIDYLEKLALEVRRQHPQWEPGAVRAHLKHKDREEFGVPYTTARRDAFERLKLPWE